MKIEIDSQNMTVTIDGREYGLVRRDCQPPDNSNPCLFFTDDGYPVSESGKVWYVSLINYEIFYVHEWRNAIHTRLQDKKYFSTKSAAKDFVAENKRLLSVMDVKKVYDEAQRALGTKVLIERLKEVAKNRIKGE
jgi:hypothetical protein